MLIFENNMIISTILAIFIWSINLDRKKFEIAHEIKQVCWLRNCRTFYKISKKWYIFNIFIK